MVLLEPEPVSPELVLVDPELAECERARLREKARLEAFIDVEVLRRAVERDTGDIAIWEDEPQGTRGRDAANFARRRLLPAALMCSLLANGYFAADLLGRLDKESAAVVPVAVRPAVISQVPEPSTGAVAVAQTARSRPASRRITSRAEVERKLGELILVAPTRKLPRAFVDPATGLVRNNVRVLCRPKKHSYLCAIQLPSDGPTGALFVRYRTSRKGKDLFRWYGYKRG